MRDVNYIEFREKTIKKLMELFPEWSYEEAEAFYLENKEKLIEDHFHVSAKKYEYKNKGDKR